MVEEDVEVGRRGTEKYNGLSFAVVLRRISGSSSRARGTFKGLPGALLR